MVLTDSVEKDLPATRARLGGFLVLPKRESLPTCEDLSPPSSPTLAGYATPREHPRSRSAPPTPTENSFTWQRFSSPDAVDDVTIGNLEDLDFDNLFKDEVEDVPLPPADIPYHDLPESSTSSDHQFHVRRISRASIAPEPLVKPNHVRDGTTAIGIELMDDGSNELSPLQECFTCDQGASSSSKKRESAHCGREESNAKRRVPTTDVNRLDPVSSTTWSFSMLPQDPEQLTSGKFLTESPFKRHLSSSSAKHAENEDFTKPEFQNDVSTEVKQGNVSPDPGDGSATTHPSLSELGDYSTQLYKALQEKLAFRRQLLEQENMHRKREREVACKAELEYIEHLKRLNVAEAKELEILQRDQASKLGAWYDVSPSDRRP